MNNYGILTSYIITYYFVSTIRPPTLTPSAPMGDGTFLILPFLLAGHTL
jgi:hypothetical protein